MAKNSGQMSDLVLFLLRFGSGALLFWQHALSKVTSGYTAMANGGDWAFGNFVASMGFPFSRALAIIAALCEFLGSALLAAGLFTRYAALAVTGVMAVAAYHHLTTDRKFELAALYLLIALAFVFVQPGKFSLDDWLRHRKRR